MKATNLIGLDTEKSQKVINLLNELLANYQIYYQEFARISLECTR